MLRRLGMQSASRLLLPVCRAGRGGSHVSRWPHGGPSGLDCEGLAGKRPAHTLD